MGHIELNIQVNNPNFWLKNAPLIFVIGGVIDILSATIWQRVVTGFTKIGFGLWAYACLNGLWGFSFAVTWPVLLIYFGVNAMFGTNKYRRRKYKNN